MEKTVLKRLFGFLRDLTDQREADPPSGDDPGDKWRPRLTVIEGGKGKGKWDGNERRKPCAVIGIPYSSDAADDTVEKEEENIMKHIAKYMYVFAAVAAAVFALSACGGGGGGGSTPVATSAPVVSAGTMTKGSVVVNGVKFTAAAGATFRVDDNPGATEAQLRDGMEVKVKGQINSDRVTGQFEKVEAEPRVRGQMSGRGADDFTVHNHHVITDDNTVYEDRSAGGAFTNISFNDLADLNEVEVHGGLDDLGNVRATRVERRNDNPNDEVRGVVTAKVGNVISIGSFSIDITGVPTSPVGQAVNVGTLVEVHLNAAGTVATLVDIEDLEDAEFEPAEGQEIEVEGFISGYAGGTTFQVNGVDVSLKTGTVKTRFEGGAEADLANGVKVEVEGHRSGETLLLDKVKFKHTRIILVGTAAANPPATLLGKTLRYTSSTRTTWDGTGKAQIRGFDDGTGKVVVERLENAQGGGDKDIVQARVTNKTGNELTFFGFTANLTGISPANLKRGDTGGTFANLPDFLAAITPSSTTPPGTLVKVKGTVTGNAFATPPDEAEIEFED